MAQPVIQASFNGGEWSPKLYARVDVAKYQSGAALLRNWYVDYRGGATTCPGSKWIYQTISVDPVRLIPFQASLTVSYVLVFEIGRLYFINNGAPVLEAPLAITAITQANPGQVSVANTFSAGDRVYISNVVGMTELNGNYYTVAAPTATDFLLQDMNGTIVNTVPYGAYIAGGTVSHVYTVVTPYAASDLAGLKYAQDVNVMVLCHPNHAPYSLTLTSATNWALTPITIGSTVAAPGGQAVASTVAAGTVNYAYVITAVDENGQESAPSAYAPIAALQDMRVAAGAGSNTVTWVAVAGAVSYNIYRAQPRYGAAVPAGSQFGFIGNCTATTFIDSNIEADFSLCPPIPKNPFSGTGVQSVVVTNQGSYTNGALIPAVTFAGGGGSGASASPTAQIISVVIDNGGFNFAVNDTITVYGFATLRVTSVNGLGTVTGVSIVFGGTLSTGQPTNPNNYLMAATSGGGTGFYFSAIWGITSIGITSPGTGYGPAPAVVFSSGTAAATAVLGAASAGNPTVPSYHQQRLGFLGPVAVPNQVNFSQPGAPYNFDVTDPIQPDNAFQGTLKNGQLTTIQAAISQPQGLVVLGDNAAWLLNGGSAGSTFDATNLIANPQIFNGSASLPPLVAVDHILYVQSKGSIVRDLVFNWNKQVYTGQDISVQSSHLFFGYQMLEWAFAEEPTKTAQVVRNDGQLLILTYLAEQELIAWSHRDTQGSYKSIASITESSVIGNVDAVYTLVQRNINGHLVQYIERFVEQYYPVGVTDAWQVDAGLQYNGAAALSFTGAIHLANTPCTGLATDDIGNVTVISATPNATGEFTLAAPAAPATGYTRVTVGLAYTPQLKTLPLDTGNPTIQGKMKKIPAVTLRVNQALGLKIGQTFDAASLVDVEDLVLGNVGKDTNTLVEDLVSGDALQAIDPEWNVPGQYCIQQSLPYPASILGVIPQLAVGDTPK